MSVSALDANTTMTFSSNNVRADPRFTSPERGASTQEASAPARSRSNSRLTDFAALLPNVQLPDQAASRVRVPPPAQWTIGRTIDVGTDIRTSSLSFKGQGITFNLENVHSPFEPSALNPASARKTLTLRLSKEWEARFVNLEEALLARVAASSSAILGREIPEEEVQCMFKPHTKKTGDYPMNLRAKVTSVGLMATRYWDANGVRIGVLDAHEGQDFNVKIQLRSLWIANDAWGLVCDCTDIQRVAATGPECPFN